MITNLSSVPPTMNQLCKVCGEPAAGFHFGAFTCEGCKSFFGRSYNNLSAVQECKNNNQCVINKKNRTSCKACRLKKCLMVGMSKGSSRYGRRSNWFKITCLLQEQAASFDPTTAIKLGALNGYRPLSPKHFGVMEGGDEGRSLGSPALSSPDSNKSDCSVDVGEVHPNNMSATGGGAVESPFCRLPPPLHFSTPLFLPNHPYLYPHPATAPRMAQSPSHTDSDDPSKGIHGDTPEQEVPMDLSVKRTTTIIKLEEPIKTERSSECESDIEEEHGCLRTIESAAPLDLTTRA